MCKDIGIIHRTYIIVLRWKRCRSRLCSLSSNTSAMRILVGNILVNESSRFYTCSKMQNYYLKSLFFCRYFRMTIYREDMNSYKMYRLRHPRSALGLYSEVVIIRKNLLQVAYFLQVWASKYEEYTFPLRGDR